MRKGGVSAEVFNLGERCSFLGGSGPMAGHGCLEAGPQWDELRTLSLMGHPLFCACVPSSVIGREGTRMPAQVPFGTVMTVISSFNPGVSPEDTEVLCLEEQHEMVRLVLCCC